MDLHETQRPCDRLQCGLRTIVGHDGGESRPRSVTLDYNSRFRAYCIEVDSSRGKLTMLSMKSRRFATRKSSYYYLGRGAHPDTSVFPLEVSYALGDGGCRKAQGELPPLADFSKGSILHSPRSRRKKYTPHCRRQTVNVRQPYLPR